MALVASIPLLAIPGFFVGLGLAFADYIKPKQRPVWTAITLICALVLAGLGLSLGPQMDF
jgi:hypothetical protein